MLNKAEVVRTQVDLLVHYHREIEDNAETAVARLERHNSPTLASASVRRLRLCIKEQAARLLRVADELDTIQRRLQ